MHTPRRFVSVQSLNSRQTLELIPARGNMGDELFVISMGGETEGTSTAKGRAEESVAGRAAEEPAERTRRDTNVVRCIFDG